MKAVAQIGHNNPPTEMEILEQRLASYSAEQAEFERLSSREIPGEIADEKQSGEITDHIKALKILRSRVEDIFKKEKAPFWDCCKAADAWKNDYFKKIDQRIDLAGAPVLAFNKKKEEAERLRQLEIARRAREEAGKLAAEAAAHAEAGIDDTAEELAEMAQQEEIKANMITQNAVHGVVARSRGDFSMSSNRKTWTAIIESRAALDLEALRNYFAEDALDRALKAAVRDGVRSIRGAHIYQEEKLSVR